MPSPGVTSPLVPSSANACAGDPPMAVRSPTTDTIGEGGVPSVVATVSSVEFPATTGLGFALPVPLGPGGAPVTVMSSTPTHSSLPTAFVVRTRTCTIGWLFASAGRVAETGVTSVA